MSTFIGNSVQVMTSKKTPAWTREFDSLVRAIGECKSKAEEDAIISREVDLLKPRLKDAKLDKRLLKEMMVRLIYVEMLGHDASWGHVKALQACSDTNLLTKKVAYLASALFLDHKSDLIILVVNTLTQDLKSDNYLIVCTALTAACKLIGSDLVNAVLPGVVQLLNHPKELVRKKAVMVLHRFHQLDPEHEGPLHSVEVGKHFRQALCDKDPSVMSSALCALLEVTARDPKPYKNLIPSFVSILKQVAEHRLPKAFDYHRTPAPFIQIKLLKILAQMGVGDKSASENMYAVIADAMKRANTGHTIGNAIIYECVRTITSIYPNPALLQTAAESVTTFLKASSHNLRYVGIDALSRIVRINANYATEHQIAVIDCLEDPDETLKKKTLELLFKMTKPNNVEVIVEKMIEYLRTTTDDVQKADVVKRLGELAERFAPDTQWFIDTMNQVFELGGDVVEPALADNLMRLIAEGAGEDDEAADTELRAQAVSSYLALLEKPNLPDILLKVICWVLGEYGTVAGASAGEVMDQLCAITDTQSVSDGVRGFMLTAFSKLVAQSGTRLTPAAQEIVHAAASSVSTDLQQRALELETLLSLPASAKQRALPADASCEDLEVDPQLGFLSNFVQAALQNGAAPYISEADRFAMGVVRPSHQEQAVDHSHALRFTAYERTSAPEVVSVRTVSRDASPTREVGSSLVSEAAPSRVSAASSGEPQLALRNTGRSRWGPATYAPAASPAPTPVPVQSSAGVSFSGGYPDAAASKPARAASPEPEVPAGRAKLAGLLFGGGSTQASRPSRARATAPKQAGTVQAAKPAPAAAPASNLLDFGDDSAPHAQNGSAAAAPKPTAAPAADPFAMLEGLSHPSEVPPANKPALDLNALYGAAPAASSAPITSFSQTPAADPFGFNISPPQAAAPSGGIFSPPQPTSGAANADPFGLSQPSGMSQPRTWIAAPKTSRSAPMAFKGSAAAPQSKPKNDPFADLFS